MTIASQEHPASIVINSIKITKKKPVFDIRDEPVYQNGVAYSIDKYTWNWLDVLESESMPLSLNFSVGDLQDLGKRTTGYSKTFMLPANKHNNEVLTPMMAVGAERAMIYWMKARIKVNGIYVFTGLMRVEQGNTGKGGFYKCHIIQDSIGWSQAIGEETLCDLALVGPGGISPPELKSHTSVVNSWAETPDTSDFFYGLVNYGEWQAQSVNTNSTIWDYNHNADDFHPTVFAKALTDKIFATKGYSIQSNFLNSTTFKKLCHPWVSGNEYVDDDLFESGGSQSTSVELNLKTACGGTFTPPNGKIPATGIGGSTVWRDWWPPLVPGTDNGNNWTTNAQNGGYVAPFTGTYHGYIDAKMYIEKFPSTAYSACHLRLYHNGSLVTLNTNHSVDVMGNIIRDPSGTNSMYAWRQIYSYNSGASDGLSKSIEFEIDLAAGDTLSMKITGQNNSTALRSNMYISDSNFDCYPVPSSILPDKLVNLSKILPCMKQMDYLKGLTEVFNLQWTANEETKTVYCEPYNDFFGSGKVVDWSDKLDYKSWNDKFIIEELAKEINFQYKEDTSDKFSNQVYRWNERKGYDIEQSHIEVNDEKFRKEIMEMGTDVFSTTISFNAYGTDANPGVHGSSHPAAGAFGWGDLTWTDPWSQSNNPLMPAIWHENGHINTQERPEYNMRNPGFDMRLLNYYGKTNCSSYNFIDASGAVNNESTYPYLGTTNEWIKGLSSDPYSLSWGDENDGTTANNGNGFVSPGLFTKYWRVAYLKMNGGSALRTCKMNLDANDIALFDYRDLILLKIDEVNTYWTVNKIKDYTPNQNLLTTVELLEWKQDVDFGKDRSSKKPRKPPEPKKEKIISQSNDSGVVLRNDTRNSSIGTGIAFGNGVVAQNNQTVLGNYNKLNNTDILQVGSGLNPLDRSTAFTIKGSGEVEIHGGETTVEETDGIIHDLVYTDSDGNIQKLYLKKE